MRLEHGSKDGEAGDSDWTRNSLLQNNLAEDSAALSRDWGWGASGGGVSLITMTSRSLALGAVGFGVAETPLCWGGELRCDSERRCDGDEGCNGDPLAAGGTSGSAPA